MRPTDIKLKTPSDRTPGPKYCFTMTASGRDLSYSKIFKDKKSFSTEKRFRGYDELSKRTDNSVGPGSYIREQYSFTRNSLKRSTIKYLPTMKKYNSSKKNFYMVGNLLITDDYLDKKKQSKGKKEYKTGTNFKSSKTLLKKSPKLRKSEIRLQNADSTYRGLINKSGF